MDFIEVDGAQGEGGGQILRTAVAFSVIKKRPVKIVNIRAGRETPGLKRQHVSALKILTDVFGGELEGATEGSSNVRFVPGVQKKSRTSVDMGTAASITLVLQAVVPAVALTGSSLVLDMVGGTDVPWSPTSDYFQFVVRRAFKAIGIVFSLDISRRGYYPQGGGRASVSIEPGGPVNSLVLTDGPQSNEAAVVSRCARLPRNVAERQMATATSILENGGLCVADKELFVDEAVSPGSSVLACSVGEGWMLGGDAIGEKRRRAEQVGETAAERLLSAWKNGACIDSNLADMILPLLSLGSEQSRVKIQSFTGHLESGLRLAEKFTSCKWSVEDSGPNRLVRVFPEL